MLQHSSIYILNIIILHINLKNYKPMIPIANSMDWYFQLYKLIFTMPIFAPKTIGEIK